MNVSPFRKDVVAHTSEVARITTLPRRQWSDEAAAQLAQTLTRELKTPGGTMSLRPVQAVALYEAMECGGLFGPIRVGGGKTLCTLLLPLVLEAERPLLLLPAALLEKTWHDYKILREHWRLPTNIQIESYEMLSLVQSARKLEYIQPGLIVCDEVHYLKNKGAGRTRRVVRYMEAHPKTRFVALSGTVMKGSIREFAHVLRWCLKRAAPIPATDEEVSAWADALDEKVNPLGRRQPGALFSIGQADGDDDLTRARRVFQGRLLETRGVVASAKNDGVTCSLRVSPLEYEPSATTAEHIRQMREGTKDRGGKYLVRPWTTPDGWTFATPLEFKMYLRQLALGFNSYWDPRPPPEWLAARRDWASFVRETLAESHTLDTELQVANAIDAGRLHTDTLRAWRAVRDSYKADPKDMWHDDTALETCARWMERERGIVWCEHVFFARRLSRETGATYYGAQGLSDKHESITHVKSGKAIIASVKANSAGRNLQMFSTNLVTSFPPDPLTSEQMIGRTHRDGQEADEVVVDVLLGCREHHDAFQRALDGARATAETLGHNQKLLLADIVFTNIDNRKGPLWG